MIRRACLLFVFALLVGGKHDTRNTIVTRHTLAPGQEKLFNIAADSDRWIRFQIVQDPLKTSDNSCSEVENQQRIFRFCAELVPVSAQGVPNGRIVASEGAGMGFSPDEGIIRARLTSLATTELTFLVEVGR